MKKITSNSFFITGRIVERGNQHGSPFLFLYVKIQLMRREWIILLIILAIAGFFRLYNLDIAPPGLYPDEAINGNNALEALDTGDYKLFYPDNNGREGLYINILAFFFKLFGPHIWVLRLLPAVIGILTVWGIYLLAKELFNWQIGLLSGFLLSISFWHVNFSRIGFRGIMVPLLLIFAVYFLWRGFKHLSNWDFLWSGIILGLGMHTYIAFRLAPLIVIAALLVFWQKIKKDYSHSKYENLRNKYLIGFAYVLVSSILVALPILFFAYLNPDVFFGRAAQVSIFGADNPLTALLSGLGKSLAMFNFAGDYNWRHNFSGEPQLFWTIGIFFVVGFFRAIGKCWEMFKKHGHFSTVHTLTLSWFFIMLAPSFLSTEGLPHALRAIGTIPVAIIFAAEGMWWAFERMRGWYAAGDVSHRSKHLIHRLGKTRPAEATVLATIVLLIYLGITGWHQYDKYFNQWANRPETAAHFNQNLVKIGNDLNKIPNNVPKYVIVDLDGVLVDGVPMPAQTVMFVTQSYSEELQKEKNINYILPDELFKIRERNAAVMTLSGN